MHSQANNCSMMIRDFTHSVFNNPSVLVLTVIGCRIVLRTIIIILLLCGLLFLIRRHYYVISLDRNFRMPRLHLVMLVCLITSIGNSQTQILLNVRLLLLSSLQEKHSNLLGSLGRRYLCSSILFYSPSGNLLLLTILLRYRCL